MIPPFYSRFEVKIVDKPFCTSSGRVFVQTAILSFFDEEDVLVLAHDYANLPITSVYKAIDDGEPLLLEQCYVHNFSLTAYRRTRLLEKAEPVKVVSINAKESFFSSEFHIDFSQIVIESSDVIFEGAHFAKGDLSFVGANFGDGIVDFTYSVFGSSLVDFSNANFGSGEVSFKNAIFYEGVKNFQYADFGQGGVSFVNTDFGNGEVAFLNSNFNKGNVSFKVASFGEGRVVFHYAKFDTGDISFERTSFGLGEVDFRTVEFGQGKVNFNRAVFQDGDLSFEASSAEGRVTFKKTQFGNGLKNFELLEFNQATLNMEKAVFANGNISFYSSVFNQVSLSGCHINSYLDLRVAKCHRIDLSDTIVRDIVDLKPYDFDVRIDILNMVGMRLLGVVYIDWERNGVLDLISSQLTTDLDEKAEQFRLLKENFNKAGQYDHEDNAYVWFKRFEAKSKFKRNTENNLLRKIMYAPLHAFKTLVFDYAGLYATRPQRVLISMVTTLTLFSLFYYFVQVAGLGSIVSGIGGSHDEIGLLARSFYHSGITFFTIGYGDFYPLGWVRFLSNVEGFVGVFLMSYFTVAFVRSILR